jgi:lipoprotein-releasing system permease protein
MGDSVGLLSAYELKLRPHASAEQVKRRLAPQLGADYRLLTQLEQQADSFKIMQIEKWITFLIILFILLIASFNVIGALSMLIIDKEQETETLRTLGATDRMIRHIFQAEGVLITGSGAAVGLLLGILLCWAQEQFGLIKLGDGSGMFIIDSYPVSLRWSDIGWTALSVFVLGALATIYPLRSLRRQSPR